VKNVAYLCEVSRYLKYADSLRIRSAPDLLTRETHSFREANAALSKRRRAKRTSLQHGGTLTTTQEAKEIIDSREKGKRPAGEISGGAEDCSNYGRPEHNIRTCEYDEEMSNVYSSD